MSGGKGGGVGVGVTTATTGTLGISLLPNTGSFRVVFIIAVAMLTIGAVILLATGITALKQRRAQSK